MESYKHIIIVIIFAFGMFISNVLIDVDHVGTWKQKWDCFSKTVCSQDLQRGFFHKPIVMFGLMALFFGLGFGLLIHLLMDYTALI